MKRWLVSAVMILAVSLQAATPVSCRPAAGDSLSPAPQQIITSDMIRSAGLTRLSDILLLLDDWDVNTIDGFTYQTCAGGLSSFQGQTWILMIDGQRFDIDLFDNKCLNALPVTVDQVDYIEVFNLPQIHQGEFTERGLIHIHTFRPSPGISFIGRYSAGSETGDPGPYRYTDRSSRNVDKTGPDMASRIGYGGDQLYALGGLVVRDHFPTHDAAMFVRNRQIGYPDYPKQSVSASFVRFGLTGQQGTYEIIGGRSDFDDFLFWKPFGREIPVTSHFTHVGINGGSSNSSDLDIRYLLKYSEHKLDKRSNAFDLYLDWKMNNFYMNMEGCHRSAFFQVRTGFGYDRYSLYTAAPLDKDHYSIVKIYGQIDFPLSHDIRQSIGLHAARNDANTAFKGYINSCWELSPNQAITAHLSFSERLFEEDNSLWYWVKQGYRLPLGVIVVPVASTKFDYEVTGDFSKSRQFISDLTWKGRTGGHSLEIRCRYSHFADLYIEGWSFRHYSHDCSFYTPVLISTDQSGDVLGCIIILKNRLSDKLRMKFAYNYQTIAGGGEVFREAWETMPEHKFSSSITYQPVERFSINGRLYYRRATRWADYKGIDEHIEGSYSSQVNAATIFDLSFRKQFWGNRIHSSLLFRNVFNDNHRYHPIGASFDLSYWVQVSLRFGRSGY